MENGEPYLSNGVKEPTSEERVAESDSKLDSGLKYDAKDEYRIIDIDKLEDVEQIEEDNVIDDFNSARDEDYTNWRSNSVLENGSYANSPVLPNNGSHIPEVHIDGNILVFHNHSSVENDVNDERKDAQSSKPVSSVPNSPKVEKKRNDLRKSHESSFESSAEKLKTYMQMKGASWPLAEGGYDRLSSSLSASFENSTSIGRGDSISSLSQNSEDTCTTSNKHKPKQTKSEDNNKDNNKDNNDDDDDDKEEKSFSFKTLTRKQLIILSATSFTNLLSFLSLSILAPFFPAEAEKKDVNNTISGWIFGVFALVQFLTSPLFGRLLPIVGSRFMYISGLFICGGCTLLFGLLDKIDTSESIVVFVSLSFVTRILLALGCTGLSNAGFVILVKTFPDSVATVFGIGEIFTGVGMVTGPALGGFLYSAGGFILPFAVIGGCCFAALPLIWIFLPPQDDSQSEETDDLSLKAVLLHPRSIVNSIVIIVAASVWAVLDPTLEPHLRVYGLGPEMVGVLFLIMAASYSVTSPIWGRVADHLPDNRTLLIPGLLLAGVGLLLSGPSPLLGFSLSFNELWLTIVSLMILGVASSMCVIPTYDIYIDVLDDLGYPTGTRSYGMVSGLWVSMYAFGDFAGPSFGGFVFDSVGFEWLMTGVAGICGFTAVLVAVAWITERKCCKKSKKDYVEYTITEKTPLISTMPDDALNSTDALATYPPSTTSNLL